MTYEAVLIGTQTWMAENLNYDVTGSKCHTTSNYNCTTTCGRLYDWATAIVLSGCNSKLCASEISEKYRGVCPEGWHIPSDADWNVLIKVVDPSCSDKTRCDKAGTKLKATSGWSNSNNGTPKGTDDYGFSARACGNSVASRFYSAGISTLWWSASEYNDKQAYYLYMGYDNEDTQRNHDNDKSYFFSARCVKD